MVNNLKELREERGWSLLQLAALSGVPPELIGRLELSEDFEGYKPTDILKIARPFKVPVREIFVFEGWE